MDHREAEASAAFLYEARVGERAGRQFPTAGFGPVAEAVPQCVVADRALVAPPTIARPGQKSVAIAPLRLAQLAEDELSKPRMEELVAGCCPRRTFLWFHKALGQGPYRVEVLKQFQRAGGADDRVRGIACLLPDEVGKKRRQMVVRKRFLGSRYQSEDGRDRPRWWRVPLPSRVTAPILFARQQGIQQPGPLRLQPIIQAVGILEGSSSHARSALKVGRSLRHKTASGKATLRGQYQLPDQPRRHSQIPRSTLPAKILLNIVDVGLIEGREDHAIADHRVGEPIQVLAGSGGEHDLDSRRQSPRKGTREGYSRKAPPPRMPRPNRQRALPPFAPGRGTRWPE